MFEYYKKEELRKILENARVFFSTMFTFHFLLLFHVCLTHFYLGLIMWFERDWVWEVEEESSGLEDHGMGTKAVGENKEKGSVRRRLDA